MEGGEEARDPHSHLAKDEAAAWAGSEDAGADRGGAGEEATKATKTTADGGYSEVT